MRNDERTHDPVGSQELPKSNSLILDSSGKHLELPFGLALFRFGNALYRFFCCNTGWLCRSRYWIHMTCPRFIHSSLSELNDGESTERK